MIMVGYLSKGKLCKNTVGLCCCAGAAGCRDALYVDRHVHRTQQFGKATHTRCSCSMCEPGVTIGYIHVCLLAVFLPTAFVGALLHFLEYHLTNCATKNPLKPAAGMCIMSPECSLTCTCVLMYNDNKMDTHQ